MKVLVACEFSGVVREAFRKRGHDAWSCDLLPALDESQHHIQGDILAMPRFILTEAWDLVIAHPPCTYLSNMSNCRIKEPGRIEERQKALEFFTMCALMPTAPKVCVENPRGYPERAWMKATQIVQPWMFGHPWTKATCLWLKGLPPLVPTNVVKPKRIHDGKRWRTFVDQQSNWRGDAHKTRSVTFQGLADAMAEQWG